MMFKSLMGLFMLLRREVQDGGVKEKGREANSSKSILDTREGREEKSNRKGES